MGCHVTWFVQVLRMWHLPEELATPAPAVVDVYVCGLRPRDLDRSWPPGPSAWVNEQFMALNRNSPEGYLMGKVSGLSEYSLYDRLLFISEFYLKKKARTLKENI